MRQVSEKGIICPSCRKSVINEESQKSREKYRHLVEPDGTEILMCSHCKSWLQHNDQTGEWGKCEIDVEALNKDPRLPTPDIRLNNLTKLQTAEIYGMSEQQQLRFGFNYTYFERFPDEAVKICVDIGNFVSHGYYVGLHRSIDPETRLYNTGRINVFTGLHSYFGLDRRRIILDPKDINLNQDLFFQSVDINEKPLSAKEIFNIYNIYGNTNREVLFQFNRVKFENFVEDAIVICNRISLLVYERHLVELSLAIDPSTRKPISGKIIVIANKESPVPTVPPLIYPFPKKRGTNKLLSLEAIEWLGDNPTPSALAANRFKDNIEAVEFVKRLYSAGAVRVDVEDVSQDNTGIYTDTLKVYLPKDIQKRMGVFKIYNQEVQKQGFDEEGDDGLKEYLTFWWD